MRGRDTPLVIYTGRKVWRLVPHSHQLRLAYSYNAPTIVRYIVADHHQRFCGGIIDNELFR